MNKPTSRTIIINPKEVDKKRHWAVNSFVVDAKNMESLCKCEEICKSMGLKDLSVQYLGGLSSLITLKDPLEVDSLLQNKKELWKPFWQSVLRWHEDYTQKYRIAWLIVRGVPTILCEAETFELIGNSFGKVVHKMTSFQDEELLHYDMIGILTTQLEVIKEAITIRWKNKSFKIWVEEKTKFWHPQLLAGISSTAKMAHDFPAEKTQSQPCIYDPSKFPAHDYNFSCDMECETIFEKRQQKSPPTCCLCPHS